MKCVACSGELKQYKNKNDVQECVRCGGLHGHCYKGDFSEYVILQFATHDVRPEDMKYFDFELVGSKGVERVHGFFDVKTKKVVQIG